MDPQPPKQVNGQANGPEPQADYDKPVAYDQQGHPLYAHPQQAAASGDAPQQPQTVYIARPLQPEKTIIPEEIAQRHAESQKRYPHLNLSEGEYIISAVRRHPIGLIRIWAAAVVTMFAFMLMYVLLFMTGDENSAGSILGEGTAESIALPLFIFLVGIVSLGAFIASYVYNNNRFYLTNESVIQEIQTSLFSRHEQTVSLTNIEDASYKQNGIIASMFNYGTIRLSTEGDETTYRFSYVANPKTHIAVLNNAVEAFKNGRAVH